MIAEITSFTSTEKYGLTINEHTGEVEECKCKSFHFSGRRYTCKHSQEFDKELQRAATFILLQRMVQGMHETALCNWQMSLDPRFQ
jgi:hypothetical protein